MMTTAATPRRSGLVFLFLVLMRVVGMMAVTAAATAARSLDFFSLLGMTATAAAHGFRLALPEQGFD
jgi:hypothetical protein